MIVLTKCVQELHKTFWPDSSKSMPENGHLYELNAVFRNSEIPKF